MPRSMQPCCTTDHDVDEIAVGSASIRTVVTVLPMAASAALNLSMHASQVAADMATASCSADEAELHEEMSIPLTDGVNTDGVNVTYESVTAERGVGRSART